MLSTAKPSSSSVIWLADRSISVSFSSLSTISFSCYSYVLSSITLPFAFPFFSSAYRQLYVSAFGAIFFDSYLGNPGGYPASLVSRAEYCLTTALFFDEQPSLTQQLCPYNIIAPFYVRNDNLANFTVSNVTYAMNNSNACFWFSNQSVSTTQSSLSASFQVCLSASGTIDISYSSSDNPYLSSIEYIVGLRNGYTILPAELSGNYSSSQWLPGNSGSLSYWLTPDRSVVRPGSSISFCPMSASACVTPSLIPTAGSVIVRIASTNFGCISAMPPSTSLTCRFGSFSVAASYNATSSTVQCIAPRGSNNTLVLLALYLDDRPVFFNNTLVITYLDGAASDVSSIASMCAECSHFLPVSYCTADCSGLIQGTAALDSCGICAGGSTGIVAESSRDCAGFCFGPFTLSSQGQCQCTQSACANWTNTVPYAPVFSELQYIWFYDRQSAQLQLYANSTPIVLSQDALYPVNLGFSFSYFNSSISRIFISPYGGLFLDQEQSSCLSNATAIFYGNVQSSSSCFLRLIAASFANYIVPAQSSAIDYLLNSSALCVRYRSMTDRTFPSAVDSFSVCIFAQDSSIRMFFSTVSPQIVQRNWVVGLRNGFSVLPPQFGFASSSSAWLLNNSRSRQSWNLPYRASIQANTSLLFCRISRDVCMSPNTVAPAGQAIITLAAVDLSCFASVDWNQHSLQCLFGKLNVSAVFNASTNIIQCSAPPGSLNSIVLLSLLFDGRPVKFANVFLS